MSDPPTAINHRHAVRAALLRSIERYTSVMGPQATRNVLISYAILVESLYELETMEGDPE